MPSKRVQELERLLKTIRDAGSVLLNIDMWDRWGSHHASDEEKAQYEADSSAAVSARERARRELEALVTRTRTEAPAEIEAWADAHDRFLAAFLADCTDDTAAYVAKEERQKWAEVRAGTLPYVDENVYYVTIDRDRYREMFGIEP